MTNSFTIPNLVKSTERIQAEMDLDLIGALSQNPDTFNKLLSNLSTILNDILHNAENYLNQNGKSAADLAIRSRRAYQWIKFLSNQSNLSRHLAALRKVGSLLSGQRQSWVDKHLKIDFSFYHISPLYKIRQQGKIQKVIVQESFIIAPDQVLISILRSLCSPKSNPSSNSIRSYTASRSYRNLREHLEYLAIPPGSFAQGENYDLLDSFNRVNQAYFQGKLSQPHLIWSERLTRKKYGHFQEDTNTVSISRTLDHSDVPPYVVDYVMYHELLHKHLGVKRKNGRRYSHTKEFKQAESKYKKIQRAQRFLTRLTQAPAIN